MARRALVAGADGGLGGACVAALEASGWQVVGVDRAGDVDVTAPGGAERAVELATSTLGGLEAIVHAVGMSGRSLGDGPVTRCTDEAWDEVLRVNLTSVFRLLRAGLPPLRSHGGAFVAIGSVLSTSTDDDFLTAAYAASKGALTSLARVAAREVAADAVRVNVVAAGLVRTPMSTRAVEDPGITDRLVTLQPLGGAPLEPEEVAGAVVWLASDAARKVTGATLAVDGGWTLR